MKQKKKELERNNMGKKGKEKEKEKKASNAQTRFHNNTISLSRQRCPRGDCARESSRQNRARYGGGPSSLQHSHAQPTTRRLGALRSFYEHRREQRREQRREYRQRVSLRDFVCHFSTEDDYGSSTIPL
jgi:hypothetical protein